MNLDKAALSLANEMSIHIIGSKMITDGDACIECVKMVKKAMEQVIEAERKGCQATTFGKS